VHYFLSNGICVASCPAGTFANTAQNTCDPCAHGAATCLSLIDALTCEANYILSNGICAPNGVGPGDIYLGTAANFVILSKVGITNTGISIITGNIGVYPVAATTITGLNYAPYTATSTSTTSPQVIGLIYGADMAPPTPANLGTAVGDMQNAYTTAANLPDPTQTNLGGGDLSGLTLVPGLYNWAGNVVINSAVSFDGGPHDTWILQIPGTLTVGVAVDIILLGGAQASNIFWQVAGAVTIQAGSIFEGTILAKTNVALGSGVSFTGRILAQTAATLIADGVTISSP
jgi:hypothetical protein